MWAILHVGQELGRAGPGTRATWILYPSEKAHCLPCYMERCHVPIALRTRRTRHLFHSPQMYSPTLPERDLGGASINTTCSDLNTPGSFPLFLSGL